MASIQIEQINKIYPDNHVALSKVSFSVADGEFMVILGPSGCGKTTLLRILAGLESPTEGSIRFDQKKMCSVAPQNRHVAMVFQQAALYPHMTVFENIAFPLRSRKNMKSSAIEQKVQEAAELLNLESLLSRKPSTLSGGQSQKAALARAMVQEPAIFLFDEPLSDLDPLSRFQFRQEIKAIQQKLKATVIYVTHDQTEALALADQVCIIKQGYVQQIGSPKEIYHSPANTFVAEFIGSPPMNLFQATVTEYNDQLSLVLQDQQIILPTDYNSTLKDYIGQELTIGIRPEEIILANGQNDNSATLSGQVITQEWLGHCTHSWIQVTSELKLCLVSTKDEQGLDNRKIDLVLNPEKLYFFENTTVGKSIELLDSKNAPAHITV